MLSRFRIAVLAGLSALVASVVFSGNGLRVVARSTNVSFKATVNMADGRIGHIAVLPANGKVLVAGSTRSNLGPTGPLAEFYDMTPLRYRAAR